MGVDIDRDMVIIAKARSRNCLFIIADAHNLPFKNDAFKPIISFLLLPYVDERKVLAEMSRVLSKDGMIIIRTHGLGYPLKSVFSNERRLTFSQRLKYMLIIVNSLLSLFLGKKLGDTFQFKSNVCKLLKSYGVQVVEIRNEKKFHTSSS